MRNPIVIAGVLAIGGAVWIASGQFSAGDKTASANGVGATETEAPLAAVRVRTLEAQERQRFIRINGRTEESRRVVIRAETPGPIYEIDVPEGAVVKEGQVIARQSEEDRRALLAEAQALEKQRNIEYRAASELARKGFRSGTKLAEAQAQLEAAQARSKTMRLDLARTQIKAPFEGILETRHVEKGDFVQKGDQIATVVDLDPLLAVGFVNERDVAAIEVGRKGRVRIIDGREVEGTVRFVSTVADAATRSFAVELEIPNEARKIRAGLTGELLLPLSPVSAFLISPAWLALADDGAIGVRAVGPSDTVVFAPVKVVADTPEGLWISGLPDRIRVITVGHEFVKTGQRVRAVLDAQAAGT